MTNLEKGATSSYTDFCKEVPMNAVFTNVVNTDGSAAVIPSVPFPVLNCTDDVNVPSRHEGYVVRKDLLRSLLAFLQSNRGDALLLTGPTGSGKTSLIMEVCARLNWPVASVTCNERLEFQALKGSYVLSQKKGESQPTMNYQDGPLTRAMRDGMVLVINEFDMLSPGEASGLNDVLEGRPLILETGEVVKPHPLFRVVCTANSRGSGDESGLYTGVQQQNVAAMDRYRVLEVGYPAEDVEIKLLSSIFKGSLGDSEGESLARTMVRVANAVRAQFIGLVGMEGTISVPVSTRCLTRWAYLSLDYRGSGNPMRLALNEALLNRTNDSDREAINSICLAEFGACWNNPIE